MRNAIGGGTSTQSGGRNDGYDLIVSDLVSLIERVRESMKLVESAIAAESPPGGQELAANVVVLDDVTPRYAMVCAELTASDAGLGTALHLLLDSRTYGTGGWDESVRRPVRTVGRA